MGDLTYRAIGAGDFDALHGIVSHWAVVRQLGGWPWPANPSFTQGRCKPYTGTGFVHGVCLHGKLIGSMAVTGGELGYMFAPQTHRRGIATRAAKDAIAQAFAEYDWPTLRAGCWHDNAASARVLTKCGFTHWQTRFEHSKARGYPVITHHYRLTRTAWQRLRTASQ
jgi:RimJ/RimL family protein N-acetyltransferase